MKKFFAYFAFCVTIIVGLAVSSCSQCGNVDCGTNGQCDETDGSCLCDAGYELGATSGKCDTETRAKFVSSTWIGTEACGATPSPNVPLTISNDPSDVTKVRLSNFSNVDCNGNPVVATATVDGNNLKNFTADSCGGDYSITTASGVLSGSTLTLTYTVVIGGTSYTCNATYTK
ncbi:MAG: hypothetical protein K1X92_09300 [Bacteroidia bacterium]|nr:hypothetical protein [Bacteroidia bacterium]